MAVRRITEADKLLDYEDRMARTLGEKLSSARRRSALTLGGGIDLVVIEETGKPTRVMLAERNASAILEVTAAQLEKAVEFVRKCMAQPPPVRRRPR